MMDMYFSGNKLFKMTEEFLPAYIQGTRHCRSTEGCQTGVCSFHERTYV